MSGIQNIRILMNVSLMMSLFEMFVFFFDRKSVRPTVLMSVKSYTISDEHNINDKMCHKQNMTKTPTTITLLSRWVSTITTTNNNKSEEKPFKCFYRRKKHKKNRENESDIYCVSERHNVSIGGDSIQPDEGEFLLRSLASHFRSFGAIVIGVIFLNAAVLVINITITLILFYTHASK